MPSEQSAYPLEILVFPESKGDAKWHRAGGELFLGIDHTAIVINDTETSLRFYRDVLGLSVTGESLNYGIEQERLNLVFGARLRITGLRAAEGPGIEFLEYLSPQDGRPMPADERPNDLIHWQTVLLTRDLETVTDHPSRPSLVSSGPVVLPDTSLGFQKGALIRDPDGHVPLRDRSKNFGARRQLLGARAGQFVRGGHELLRQHRCRQPGSHGDSQRASRR